ncbi:alpha/beta hydrolase [Zhongshania borealis]|jgi:4,5:9,10-diseco-3-hydroxy-5,9,17-trioxoandrosta-1(10),2-diene-4-oate hydrolase|uniref:2-hydroxy-6-oxonona-2,4-dienedioate hydrolase n=1 Tax=Zhongshania borealis TaxID=889488 RepID=A0ABP7X1S3_9GAMM|tara:strand:- start:2966 stop:3796 length:831 start_codon:yes stop_codon:yes gene_type:complete
MALNGVLPDENYAICPNGYRIHYIDRGEGPVVVFLHGSGPGASGHSNFKQNYLTIAEQGYRCIVLDLIGFGFSDKPDDVDHPLSFFVECVKQALDLAGVTECFVIGNSLGGAVATGLALEYPDLVKKLVLLAPGGMSQTEEYFAMPGMQKMFEVYGSGEPITPEIMKELFSFGLMYNPKYATDELVAERFQIMELMNGHVMITMQIPYLAERLKELSCPVLAFWGANERMMPDSGILAVAKNCANLKFVIVSECGHWVMVEHKDLFNKECLEFFAA